MTLTCTCRVFCSFQKVPPGYQPFTIAQRLGAVVRNGGKLLAVGTVASLVGVGATDLLISTRQVSAQSQRVLTIMEAKRTRGCTCFISCTPCAGAGSRVHSAECAAESIHYGSALWLVHVSLQQHQVASAHGLLQQARMRMQRVTLVLSINAHSTCSRYQLVAGIIEERGIEEYIADRRICNVLSFIVRTSNTFVGSLLWLDFIRFFGLQSSGH